MNRFYNSRIYQFISKNKYIFFLVMLLLGMSLVLYKSYVFGGKLFLFEDFGSDSVRVSLPTYIFLFDWFRNGMPLWSDKLGIGTSVLSHGEILFDPFTYFLFIFGKANIIYMFVYMVIAKIILAGIFFWLFLGKYSKYTLSPFAKIIASLVYVFGGYMIVVGQNYVFSTIYVYLPLILLGFEIWFQYKKKWLLVTMLTLTALYFFYFFYMTAIFFAIYAIFRYFSIYKYKLKHFLNYLLSLGGMGLIAIGLGAFYWLPFLILTFSNLRVGSSSPTFYTMFVPQLSVVITALGRIFGYDIFGAPKIYLGFNGDYYQLALYSSVATLIFLPQAFLEKNKKRRFTTIGFFITSLIFIFIPFFAYIFNAFSDFTYRWTYFIHFSLAFLLALGVNSVFKSRKISYKLLIGTVILLLTISLVVIFTITAMGVNSAFNFKTVNEASQIFTAYLDNFKNLQVFKELFLGNFRAFLKDYVLIAGYVFLTIMFFRTKHKKIIKLLILILICIELVRLPTSFINSRLTTNPDPVKNHLGYFDNTNGAVSYLNAFDNSIYRIDKSYNSVVSEYGFIASDNEAMVQSFRGLKSYNSNNQPNYIRFLQYSGIYVKYPDPKWIKPSGTRPEDFKDANLNYINGVGNRYLLQSFLGVKYYLTKSKTSISLPSYYTFMTTIAGINIYKNNYYLPLGMTFNSYITHAEFMKLNNSEKDLALLSSVVVDNKNELLDILNKNTTKVFNDTLSGAGVSDLINERRKNSLQLISYGEDNILGTVNISQNRILLLTIPYDNGWSLYVDGRKTSALKVDGGLIGVKLSPGKHIVEFKYFPPGMKVGIVITVLTSFFILIFLIFKKRILKISSKIGKFLMLYYKSNLN